MDEPMPEPTSSAQSQATEIIRIVWTTDDIKSIAEAAGVDEETALQRAIEWGKYIEETANSLCATQLASVVETDSP